MKYRKKPIVIEAEQATHSGIVDTLEGEMRYEAGDWIVTGIKGEHYPVRDDIFKATYEPADTLALPTVYAIVRQYLEAHGYDGLVCAWGECGCEISDLMPCGNDIISDCQPGYSVPCPDDCEFHGVCDWHMSTTKPEEV